LFADFIYGVRGMKRGDEIPFQHGWSAFGVFLHKPNRCLRVGRTNKIHDQHRRTWLGAACGGVPEREGIGEVMKQAVTDDRIKSARFNGAVWKITPLQRDSRIQIGVMNRFSGECEHGIRTINPDDGDFRKSSHESDRDIRGAAAKIDDAPSGEIGKPFSKIAWDLSMRFRPVRGSICGRLLSVVHQFGFGCALHLFSVGSTIY